jgi:hypothetical protein
MAEGGSYTSPSRVGRFYHAIEENPPMLASFFYYLVTAAKAVSPRMGKIVAISKVGGLHHRYERLAA